MEYNGYTLHQISNHPTLTTMTRFVSWAGLEIEADANYGFYIKLKYRLWAFIDDVELPISPDAKYVTLLADNSTCVDSEGQIVECGTEGSIGEYDFYIALMDEPIIIEDFVVNKIPWADAQGKFNTF
ncbi:MAG: hypothetical protein ACK5DE_08700 [Bacteroidota bacterium]